MPMLATFYDAKIFVRGPNGLRTVAADDFFVDALTNCLEPDEIVIEVEFPVLDHDGWAFEEVARRFGDFALASIALSVRRTETRLEDARVAVMGVADTPLRLRDAEQELIALAVDERLPELFSEIVVTKVAPNDDLHASGEYRRHLLKELSQRALRTALEAGERLT